MGCGSFRWLPLALDCLLKKCFCCGYVAFGEQHDARTIGLVDVAIGLVVIHTHLGHRPLLRCDKCLGRLTHQ